VNFLLLEYEQDESKDETFKSSNTHPLFYDEDEALQYAEDNHIYGKIEVYDDNEWEDYINELSDDIPDYVRLIEW